MPPLSSRVSHHRYAALVDISIPAGTLGLFIEWITKALFLDSYRFSHAEHLKCFQAGKNFHELGDFFEFDIHLECDHVSNATVPTSFLILRNRSGQAFNRVELLVEANGGYVKYQDFTTLIAVGDIPLVVYLPRIPLKEIELTSTKRIITPYRDVTVMVFVHDDSIPECKSKAKSQAISPTYTEFLNSSWDEKWGTVWNLDYIESCKADLRNKLKFYLVSRNRWPMAGESRSLFFRTYKLLRLLVGAPLFSVLSRSWVISLIFWVPIFVRCQKLEPSTDG